MFKCCSRYDQKKPTGPLGRLFDNKRRRQSGFRYISGTRRQRNLFVDDTHVRRYSKIVLDLSTYVTRGVRELGEKKSKNVNKLYLFCKTT